MKRIGKWIFFFTIMVIIFDINSHYFMVFGKPYQSKQNYNNSFNFEDKNSTTGIILKIKPMDLFFFFIKDTHTSQIRNYYSTSLPIIITFLSSYILDKKSHHLFNHLYMIFWLTNDYSMLRHYFFFKK